MNARSSLALALLCLLSPMAAHASAGINLCWSNCFSDGGVSNRTSACTSNTGNAGTLVGSFELGSAIVGDGTPANTGGVTGVEIVLTLASAGTTLPAWWLINAPASGGGCRGTALSMNAAIPLTASNCFDWAGGVAAGGLAAYRVGLSGPTSARIVAGFAVATPVDVPAAAEMFAFNVVITNAKTVGAGNCAGCTTPVCIVFSQINVVPGIAAGVRMDAPANGPGSNVCTWQGGAGVTSLLGNGCPAATPTRNTTWGSVKSLYHN